MPKSYTKNERLLKREEYIKSITGDLTSYAALIGESFASRINLPAQIIRDAHHPSLGRYKERLLMTFLSEFIPRRYDVGTGFVLFPTERLFESGIQKDYDFLSGSDHVVSRQCDIIVYDANEFPTVFRDGEFVIVRPESVRSIVEVKGSISPDDIKSFMTHFIDFGRKWQRCKKFYKDHYQRPELRNPWLFVMAWQVAVDTKGRPKMDGKRLRSKITEIYKRQLKSEELRDFLVLNQAFIYNDCQVASTLMPFGDGLQFGYSTYSGRFVRFVDNGSVVEAGDRTVASLLAGIHCSLETPFNPFFSYADQTDHPKLNPHKDQGFSCWIEEDDDVRRLFDYKPFIEKVE